MTMSTNSSRASQRAKWEGGAVMHFAVRSLLRLPLWAALLYLAPSASGFTRRGSLRRRRLGLVAAVALALGLPPASGSALPTLDQDFEPPASEINGIGHT